VTAGLFVTGTDTGAGKSVLTAAIVAALTAQGRRVAAVKPALTGLDEPDDNAPWPLDHELLARAAGTSTEDVAHVTFGPPMSPHLAAELAGRPIDPEDLVAATRRKAAAGDVAIVEGVGGLLVPLATRPPYLVRDFARDVGLPLIVAARPGLGTINHTLLTLEAARATGLEVRGVVLTPWPGEPTAIERSNRDTIAELGEVPVATLPPLAGPDLDALAAAGAALPLDAWLSG
jgi:dethiobiotin synthetase